MEGGGGGRRPSWEREEQFRSLLHRAAKKASREMIDTIADIAVRDDKVVSGCRRSLPLCRPHSAPLTERCSPGLACLNACQALPLPLNGTRTQLLASIRRLHASYVAENHHFQTSKPSARLPCPQAYKAVCALLLHEMKQLKPAYRLKLFFVASAILRQSKSRRGDRDKYGELGAGRQDGVGWQAWMVACCTTVGWRLRLHARSAASHALLLADARKVGGCPPHPAPNPAARPPATLPIHLSHLLPTTWATPAPAAARFAPLLDGMADLLATLPADQLASVLKVLDVWWRDEIFPPATVAALQKRFSGLLEAARQGGGGAGSSGGGAGAVAAVSPALGVAASASGAAAAAAAPPPPQLSSMSPGSLSGQAGAAAAGSSQGQAYAAAAAAQASQVSKAAGGSTPVPPAAADSLSSRPLAAAAANPPLHTVGSSSQLLRQQSTEAYDPLAAALEQPGSMLAAALPPVPMQSSGVPPPPPPILAPGQPPAGAWQQLQQQFQQAAAQGAWRQGQQNQQQNQQQQQQQNQQQQPATGAWQPTILAPQVHQQAITAASQHREQQPQPVTADAWQQHGAQHIRGAASPAPPPAPRHAPGFPMPVQAFLPAQGAVQQQQRPAPVDAAGNGSILPTPPPLDPHQEDGAPPPPPPLAAAVLAANGGLPAGIPAATGTAAGGAEQNPGRKRKSRWSDD